VSPVTDEPLVRHIDDLESSEGFPGILQQIIHSERGILVKKFDMGAAFSTETHAHPEVQVMIVLDGEFHMEVAGKDVHLTAGTLLTIPGGTRHRAWSDGTPATGIDVIYLPASS